MKKVLFSASAAALALMAASPAMSATIVNCATVSGDCIDTDENVLLSNGTNQASVTGSTQNTGVSVLFTSDGNTLDSASGQAVVSAFDLVLENLTFTLLNGATFQTAFFNITPLNGQQDAFETGSLVFTFSDGSTSTQALAGNGNNQFGVTGDAGVGISSVTFVSAGTGLGVESLRQLRLGGVAIASAVPEPGTWAMMLVGFGAVGHSMRSRRSKTVRMQIA
jgi:hypothetical protein